MAKSTDPLKAASDTSSGVRQTNVLADAMKAVNAASKINVLTELARPITTRIPEINALTSVAKSLDAMKPPQVNALTSLAGKVQPPGDLDPTPSIPALKPIRASEVGTPAVVRRPVGAVSDLGAFVRLRRQDMNLTQQELADAAGTGRRFISELEAGKATLEIGKVIHVCRYLGIDLSAAARSVG